MAGRKKKLKIKKRGNLPHGVCIVSVCPVRRRPSDKEEIVTQLLFGECIDILLKKHNNWMHIKCRYDGYEGWIDSKQVARISESEILEYESDRNYSLELSQTISNPIEAFPILLGSSLPKFDGLHCYLHDYKYLYNGTVISPSKIPYISPGLVTRLAKKYIHAPYLWGGRSVFGIDCSGFTQMVFKLLGIKLPRDASQQINEGILVDFLEMTQVGDLAFFENEDKRITHVGIILEGNMIIHASGRVRIDKLDHQGIYNVNTKKYTHKLRVIKRLIEFSTEEE